MLGPGAIATRSLSVFRAISLFCAQKQVKTVLTAQKQALLEYFSPYLKTQGAKTLQIERHTHKSPLALYGIQST